MEEEGHYLKIWADLLQGKEPMKTKECEAEKMLRLEIASLKVRVKDLEERQRNTLKEIADRVSSFLERGKEELEEYKRARENMLLNVPSLLMFIDLQDRVTSLEKKNEI